tara:strand:+ start:55 stop:561 length:507 start_codon:yes stop_codon:yes gene_type:complete
MLASLPKKALAVASSLLLAGCGAGGPPLSGYGGNQDFDHFIDREWFQQSVSEYERCVAGTPGGVGGKYEKAPDCWVFVLNKARVAKENSKWGGESDGAPGLGGGSSGGSGTGGSGCNSFAASEGTSAGGGQASAESGGESSNAGGGNADAASGGESSSAGGGSASASC